MMNTCTHTRVDISGNGLNQSAWKQFWTPPAVARLMAGFFPPVLPGTTRLLDAGAGDGVLTRAFLDRFLDRFPDLLGGRCQSDETAAQSMEAVMVEIDPVRCQHLRESFGQMSRQWFPPPGKKINLDIRVVEGDYLTWPEKAVPATVSSGYTHVILNPPYGKVNWRNLPLFFPRENDFRPANLYTAFLMQAMSQMLPGGHLVAIVPRSFCHGPAHRDFRRFLLRESIVHRIHQFRSRHEIFREYGVIQETIVIHLERRRDITTPPETIRLSASAREAPEQFLSWDYPYDAVLTGERDEYVVCLPTVNSLELSGLTHARAENLPDVSGFKALSHLGVEVATGRVVEFRCRRWVHFQAGRDRFPLLQPVHCRDMTSHWPEPSGKRPAWMVRNHETEKFFHPRGFYVLVRRFSTPEASRRMVSSLLMPEQLGESAFFAVENHLNVIHVRGQGLDEYFAWGLMLFLRTTGVENHFASLIGNNHVNASDLRRLPCPPRDIVRQLGVWGKSAGCPGQLDERAVDRQLAKLLAQPGP